ncbi:aldo/keto reductase [Undibacterium sp. SXout7W]|uniref:aldo/keto reductase n=1 Tax=Undibacterium sp. SXout7W TaxID=3413049 RepID=UPI003BF0BB48
MKQRQLGQFSVSAIGLGCMNLSHAYGIPPSEQQAEQLLLSALDMGVTLFDTAALYGFGTNEELLGKVLAPHRSRFTLASKCGIFREDGKRLVDGRPETIKRTCEDSLRRLKTDVIDLYYLHRWDKKIPIEDSVGALSELVAEGKIKTIGLSEVSADTLRKAHAVHPVTALQTEYSLWTRNPEIAVLDACKQLGVTFVAFSPLGRGFLTAKMHDVIHLDDKDIRRSMPRFSVDHFAANAGLLDGLTRIAHDAGCTPAQLSLAWLLAKSDNIIPIPGTTSLQHLQEDMTADQIDLTPHLIEALDQLINQHTVIAPRYNAATQSEIDTEEF